MSGTAAGGAKAAEKNKAKHGPDFYKRIGALGGRAGKTGKFAFTKVGPDGMTGTTASACRRSGRWPVK